MSKRRMRVRLTSLLLCVALAAAFLPGGALASERETVRVGFFAFDGYHMQDENGTRSGYGYDILQRMAGHTNWRYVYVGYDKSWSEMQDMLESGEIDLLTSAQKTPEREEKFDFSHENIGVSSVVLTVKAGDMRYSQSDYANWSGMRVGLLKDNSRNEAFSDYAKEHGFTYQPVYFKTTDEMVAALQAGGSVDAVVTSNLRRVTNEWVLAQFASSPFYVMVKKGNAALLGEVNAALEKTYAAEPELNETLMTRYYAVTSANELVFTAQERAFIDANSDTVFTAIIKPDNAPYSFLKEGVHGGIMAEIAEAIFAYSGLKVQFAADKTWKAYQARMQSGDYDIRADAAWDAPRAEQYGYRLCVPYLHETAARLYKRGDVSFARIAAVKNGDVTPTADILAAAGGTAVTTYETTRDAIDAVRASMQDAVLLNLNAARYRERVEPTNSLVAEELSGCIDDYAIAVNADADPMLYTILNKASAGLNENTVNEILQRYSTYNDAPFTLRGYFYDYPMHVILAVVVLFLIAFLVLWLLLSMKRRRKAVERMEQERRQADLLRDALAAAEQADVAKSQFLSRMSHEMRTPLNAIIGFLALSKGAAPNKKIEGYLNNSEIAARQLVSVINDVLDMSSIESGKMKISREPFDFRELIYSVTNLFVSQCQAKGVAYETKLLTPTDEWLVGDQLRVSQILINLLGNAVKFTSKGYVHLSVSQTQTQEERVFLRFTVSDTGCGMSEEFITRLFKPFEQEDATTAQKYGGSGLGLSIVKSLVEMMDGAIRVESEIGRGSVFTVDLPFGKSEAHSGMPMIVGVDTLHVLAVDDDATEREYIGIVLGRIGVRFTCVEDGDAALGELARAKAAGEPYNICLVDWKMPYMDGAEATKRIRAEYGKDMIVIVVSAYDHEQADASARAAGANLFIPKPVFQSSLFDLFMTLTGGHITKQEGVVGDYRFDGRRVLLVEDNEMNRMVADSILEEMGIICEGAIDGQDGYDKFMESEPGYYDAILMDMQMPRVNGVEATRMIRASSHPDAKRVQIVALTANAFNEDIAKALSAGMNAHVAKPVELDELAAALAGAFAANKT